MQDQPRCLFGSHHPEGDPLGCPEAPTVDGKFSSGDVEPLCFEHAEMAREMHTEALTLLAAVTS